MSKVQYSYSEAMLKYKGNLPSKKDPWTARYARSTCTYNQEVYLHKKT